MNSTILFANTNFQNHFRHQKGLLPFCSTGCRCLLTKPITICVDHAWTMRGPCVDRALAVLTMYLVFHARSTHAWLIVLGVSISSSHLFVHVSSPLQAAWDEHCAEKEWLIMTSHVSSQQWRPLLFRSRKASTPHHQEANLATSITLF